METLSMFPKLKLDKPIDNKTNFIANSWTNLIVEY